ncbi:substrate-binding domain-containing protein [Streptomyces sp. MK37H]|uniref:substrate-binding domain-containing protein n=1 Tax=Streptomyces sp. MK37H TaxID=2699117 RepID=UPI0035A96995
MDGAGVAVPDEVSVAGYDDDALSRLSCFSLTTVSQGAEEQARRAVAAAVERLDEGRTTPREVVPRHHWWCGARRPRRRPRRDAHPAPAMTGSRAGDAPRQLPRGAGLLSGRVVTR